MTGKGNISRRRISRSIFKRSFKYQFGIRPYVILLTENNLSTGICFYVYLSVLEY